MQGVNELISTCNAWIFSCKSSLSLLDAISCEELLACSHFMASYNDAKFSKSDLHFAISSCAPTSCVSIATSFSPSSTDFSWARVSASPSSTDFSWARVSASWSAACCSLESFNSWHLSLYFPKSSIALNLTSSRSFSKAAHFSLPSSLPSLRYVTIAMSSFVLRSLSDRFGAALGDWVPNPSGGS